MSRSRRRRGRSRFASFPPRPCISALGWLLAAIGASPASAFDFQIQLDPKATYLRVCNDAASDAVPIDLGALGIVPGDHLLLHGLGGFDNGPGTDAPRITIAVFSSSAVLLPGSSHPRVPGAIEAGADFTTAATYYCALPTDIPEDFKADSADVVVPTGATHLFAAGHDSYYVDNTDPNGDYALGITILRATGAPVTAAAVSGPTLRPARPNPFRGGTTLECVLPAQAMLSAWVVDVSGRRVRTLEQGTPSAPGTHVLAWDGRDDRRLAVPAGVYFVVLDLDGLRLTDRLALVR